MEFLLQQLLVLFALLTVTPIVIGIVLALLAKLRLLPLAFCVLILSCIPTWASAHRVLSIGLLTACVLYPILHWTLKIVRWRQEERYYANHLLATARPRFTEEETAWMIAQRDKKYAAAEGTEYDSLETYDDEGHGDYDAEEYL